MAAFISRHIDTVTALAVAAGNQNVQGGFSQQRTTKSHSLSHSQQLSHTGPVLECLPQTERHGLACCLPWNTKTEFPGNSCAKQTSI